MRGSWREGEAKTEMASTAVAKRVLFWVNMMTGLRMIVKEAYGSAIDLVSFIGGQGRSRLDKIELSTSGCSHDAFIEWSFICSVA
jgi:hypothetical protein